MLQLDEHNRIRLERHNTATSSNIPLRNFSENQDFQGESKQSRHQLLATPWHTLTRLRNTFTSIIKLCPAEDEAIKAVETTRFN